MPNKGIGTVQVHPTWGECVSGYETFEKAIPDPSYRTQVGCLDHVMIVFSLPGAQVKKMQHERDVVNRVTPLPLVASVLSFSSSDSSNIYKWYIYILSYQVGSPPSSHMLSNYKPKSSGAPFPPLAYVSFIICLRIEAKS